MTYYVQTKESIGNKKNIKYIPKVIDNDVILNVSGKKKLYFYTRFRHFENSFKNKTCSFGNIKGQNDKDEEIYNATANDKSHYIQCFMETDEESTSMWGLYGTAEDSICVVFDFDKQIMKERDRLISVSDTDDSSNYQAAKLSNQKVVYLKTKPLQINIGESKEIFAKLKIGRYTYYKLIDDFSWGGYDIEHNDKLKELFRDELAEYIGFLKRDGWSHEK